MATISYRQGAHSLNSVISFLKKILLNFRFQHLFIQVIWFSSTVKSESVSRSAMSNSLHLVECSLPGSSVHGDSPGKNTRVGSHVFLQGIFLVQGLYTGLLHCRQIPYLPAGRSYQTITSRGENQHLTKGEYSPAYIQASPLKQMPLTDVLDPLSSHAPCSCPV